MNIASDVLFCIYCIEPIHLDEDTQCIEKGELAHTRCAWAVNDAFFTTFDPESKSDDNDK